MNKSGDLRTRLESEYREAVKQASLPPGEEERLLHPDFVAEVGDDHLITLIRKYAPDAQPTEIPRLRPGPSSINEVEERTSLDKYSRYVVCALAPVGAFVFLAIAKRYGNETSLALEQSAIKLRETPDELLIMSGRVTWGVSRALFYAAVCATVYFGLFYIIPTALKRYRLPARFLVMASALGLAFIVGLFNDQFHNHLSVPTRLIELTVKMRWSGVTKCFPLRETKPLIQCKMETSELWLYFTHAFLVALCIIIIYAVALDTRDVTRSKCSLEKMEHRLRTNMRLLRLVLYLGAAVLITEIVSISALLHWPLTFIKTEDASSAGSAERLISALLTERAINYSVFLAVLYAPAFLIFREDAYRFARLRCPDKSLAEQERWLEEQGISFSVWGYFPRMVAIFGPLLSKPVSELLDIF